MKFLISNAAEGLGCTGVVDFGHVIIHTPLSLGFIGQGA